MLLLLLVIPVGDLHLPSLVWKSANLACAPILYYLSLHSEFVHNMIGSELVTL